MSRRVAGLIAIVLLAPPAGVFAADPPSCLETATTQAQQIQCAARDLKALNEELSRVYQAVVKQYKDDKEFLEKLSRAQRAWTAFRDAELAARYPAPNKQRQYGTVYPMCANSFVAQRTRERIKQLREWLDGTEEGNVCAGSVQYKSGR